MKSIGLDQKTLEKQLRHLLYELCVDWGFCIPPADQDRIAQSEQLNAKEFAKMVLAAEGMWPKYEAKWSRRIEQRFSDQFGPSVSAAEPEKR